MYIGITNNLSRRFACHKSSARAGKKTPLYDCMRKYGIDSFLICLVKEFETLSEVQQAEIEAIAYARANNWKILNLADGGECGYVVPEERKAEWKANLSKARQGRKPALGMKHTDETKKLCGEYGKLRWDMYGRYPEEVIQYSFKEAKDKFGISKTHYYRLLKRAKSNDLS